jgi:hypothetical protein
MNNFGRPIRMNRINRMEKQIGIRDSQELAPPAVVTVA